MVLSVNSGRHTASTTTEPERLSKSVLKKFPAILTTGTFRLSGGMSSLREQASHE